MDDVQKFVMNTYQRYLIPSRQDHSLIPKPLDNFKSFHSNCNNFSDNMSINSYNNSNSNCNNNPVTPHPIRQNNESMGGRPSGVGLDVLPPHPYFYYHHYIYNLLQRRYPSVGLTINDNHTMSITPTPKTSSPSPFLFIQSQQQMHNYSQMIPMSSSDITNFDEEHNEDDVGVGGHSFYSLPLIRSRPCINSYTIGTDQKLNYRNNNAKNKHESNEDFNDTEKGNTSGTVIGIGRKSNIQRSKKRERSRTPTISPADNVYAFEEPPDKRGNNYFYDHQSPLKLSFKTDQSDLKLKSPAKCPVCHGLCSEDIHKHFITEMELFLSFFFYDKENDSSNLASNYGANNHLRVKFKQESDSLSESVETSSNPQDPQLDTFESMTNQTFKKIKNNRVARMKRNYMLSKSYENTIFFDKTDHTISSILKSPQPRSVRSGSNNKLSSFDEGPLKTENVCPISANNINIYTNDEQSKTSKNNQKSPLKNENFSESFSMIKTCSDNYRNGDKDGSYERESLSLERPESGGINHNNDILSASISNQHDKSPKILPKIIIDQDGKTYIDQNKINK
ncbi:unnamed protein product [Gordionus sp. m RMFG-2023]|uniref:probable serine/threonine-protein kinase cdc7 isoform X2 n=1 Tax=Gordionus sp. m RMFG-2023 TaxID=3053472 RepID=UPI0030E0411B